MLLRAGCRRRSISGIKGLTIHLAHGKTSRHTLTRRKHGKESDRARCRADYETLRSPPRSGDAQGKKLVYGGILATERGRTNKGCECVSQSGKRLDSPGGWLLGYGCLIRAAWRPQRRTFPATRLQRRNVLYFCQGVSVP